MSLAEVRRIGTRIRFGAFVFGVSAIAGLCGMSTATETAAANGDTRTLHLYHTHTGETIDATFRVDGHYDPAVLQQLNHFLRDWRNNDEIAMDPRLFDAVWEAYRTAGASDRIQIYSAYRSPATNAMLRRRSRAVAEHSQHMLGKAMDTTMPGFPMDRIRDAGMKLQHGGVGWYPSANFVHLDVGGVRSWPRMPYDQLASLFPDGKTVHIAANGQTLPGYEQARIELAQRGDGSELPPSQSSGGFFAWLFGGGGATSGAAHEDEEDRRAVAVASAPQAQPAAPQAEPEPAPQPARVAVAPPEAAAPPVVSQAAPVQVASLEPAQAEASRSDASPGAGAPFDQAPQTMAPQALAPQALAPQTFTPLPPRRPAELTAALDIPMPPVRPTRLASVDLASIRYSDATHDEIGGLITATASGVPMIRKAGLPSIITQGAEGVRIDHRRTPSEALAFAAADDGGPNLRAVPSPVTRPVGLRGGRRHGVAPSLDPSHNEAATRPAIEGPHLTGLRRAAHLINQASL